MAAAPGSPEDLAARQLEAYNRGDADAFAACYAEDVAILRLPGNDVVVEGREALRAHYADLFRREPLRRAELLARTVCGAFVIDHERVTSAPGAAPRFAVAIYEARDGLLRRVWFPPVAAEGPAA